MSDVVIIGAGVAFSCAAIKVVMRISENRGGGHGRGDGGASDGGGGWGGDGGSDCGGDAGGCD